MPRTLLLALAIFLPVMSQAATVDRGVGVSADIKRSCTISHIGNVNFGRMDPYYHNNTRNIDTTSTITVKCTNGSTGVRLSLGPGMNPSNPFSCLYPHRNLASPQGNRIRYYVFNEYDPSISQNFNYWGCVAGKPPQPGDAMTEILPEFTPDTTTKNVTVHIRIYGGQIMPAGNYTDSMNVALIF